MSSEVAAAGGHPVGLDVPFAVTFARAPAREGEPGRPFRGAELSRQLLAVLDDPDVAAAVKAVAAWLMSPQIRSDRTRDAYAADVEQWLEWMSARCTSVVGARRVDMERWVAHLGTQGYASSTVARKLAAVGSFYRWLVDNGAVDHNPTVGISRKQTVQAPTVPLSLDNVRLLTDEARRCGHLADAMVTLLLFAGLRVSEVTGARVADIAVTSQVRLLTVTVKGGRQVRVPLDGPGRQVGLAVDRHLLQRPVRGAPTVLANDDGTALTRHQVSWRLRQLGVVAGVGPVHPHQLRATFVTLAGDLGVPLLDTQVAVGHADPKTTRRYYDAGNAWQRHPAATLSEALHEQRGGR